MKGLARSAPRIEAMKNVSHHGTLKPKIGVVRRGYWIVIDCTGESAEKAGSAGLRTRSRNDGPGRQGLASTNLFPSPATIDFSIFGELAGDSETVAGLIARCGFNRQVTVRVASSRMRPVSVMPSGRPGVRSRPSFHAASAHGACKRAAS